MLAYNTEVFKASPPKSWEVVFKETTLPDGKSNKGRVQAFDGPIYIADAAMYLAHAKPELGIKNPYELDDKQYKAALELLREQRKIVSRYWHDAFVQIDDFTNEGVVASSSWGFQVNLLKGKNRPIASVVPQEGATGWADTTMMHARAPHPNCSYMWLEHSVSPKLQGDLAAWFGSVPAVPARQAPLASQQPEKTWPTALHTVHSPPPVPQTKTPLRPAGRLTGAPEPLRTQMSLAVGSPVTSGPLMQQPSAHEARLQTQRFLFSPDQEVSGFDNAQWSDSLPVLLQARLIQSFENFDIAHAPLRGDSGVESASRLLIDLRQFEIITSPSPRAVIAFSAKLIDTAGHLKGARIFEQSVPVDVISPPNAASAFDRAFAALARELISWMAATS